ncbi:MAG: hypothetical protein NTZ05_04355, partial [Chloroflexi bacterium]|nr:hypothetical protein [Chloroflexota bacterium]
MNGTFIARLALALLGLAGIAVGLRVSLHALSEPFDGVFVDDRLAVIRERPVLQPAGSGRLLVGDRITGVAGRRTGSRPDLDAALAAIPESALATVQVQRNGGAVTLDVRHGGFPLPLLLSQGIVGLLTLGIGLLGYLRRPQPVTAALAAFGYALLLSLLTWTFGQDAGDPATVIVFHLAFAAAMGSILHFYLLFPEPTALLRRTPALG